MATELTNEKCNYWHFRMDAHVAMKAETMVRALPKDVTQVYLLNQDYLFGQSVQRDVKTFLAKLRPDVKVVGDELIPLGKVKDFSPYVTKIKASGAQALLTGNWGPDMTLLIKAGMDAGLDVRYYTMYAHLGGGATAIGPAGNGKVRLGDAVPREHRRRDEQGGHGRVDAGVPGPAQVRLLRGGLPDHLRVHPGRHEQGGLDGPPEGRAGPGRA